MRSGLGIDTGDSPVKNIYLHKSGSHICGDTVKTEDRGT